MQKRPLGEAAFGVPEQVEDFDFCLQGECAWWDEKNSCCVIFHLVSINEKLTAFLSKEGG